MAHFVCKGGCGAVMDDMAMCEADGCKNQWEMMERCDCTDGEHGMGEAKPFVKDVNGTQLNDGDDVQVTQDLAIGGASGKLKRGDKFSNIKLIFGNTESVECRSGKSTLVIKVCYLRKV